MTTPSPDHLHPTAALSDDARRLFEALPADGSTIANPRLQARFGWADERYWSARDELEDARLVARGRGRGGVLRRTAFIAPREPAPPQVTPGAVTNAEASVVREKYLYSPILDVLQDDWKQDHRVDPLGTEIIAQQGRRATGGTWSRPDLVSVETKTYEYVPGKHLEVTTFEVKPADAIDVSGVYEALAHRRAATHSYLILHVPAASAGELEQDITEVRLVARSHGIGVIVAAEPGDYATWEELEEAERVEPDPARLNEFITNQLSEKLKSKIALSLR